MAAATKIHTATPMLKMTRRGRHVFHAMIGLVAVVVAAVAIAAFGTQPPLSSAVASDHIGTGIYEQIVVQPGDTLWGISTRLSQDADSAVILEKILAYNDLESSDLKVGQILYIPVVD